MIPSLPKKILWSALDWGLGHTIRCVPLIENYLKAGHRVSLAGNQQQIKIWKQYFPENDYKLIKGYAIKYQHKNRNLSLAILKQIPKILKTIRYENKWIKKILEQEHFDYIVSDNRYGFYHKKIPSIFITHQLHIKLPVRFFQKILNSKLHSYLNTHFNQIWVPDLSDLNKNYSGSLSHPAPKILSSKLNYIGILSRFSNFNKPLLNTTKYHTLFLLSGPEPQRTIFEQIILTETALYPNESFLLIRGCFNPTPLKIKIPKNTSMIDHVNASELWSLLFQAQSIVCRSGYTSVMELVGLNLPLIFVPTPQQTEQEYLANYLNKVHHFPYFSQSDFRLKI